MMANYTMYLYQVEEVWTEKGTSLTQEIPALLKFPDWVVNGQTFKMSAMFDDRFKFREISAETIEMWTQIANRYCNELVVKYGELIELQIANLNKLYDRFTTHTNTEQEGYFVNPINKPGTILGDTGPSGQLQGYTEGKYEEDKAFGYFRTNPELMEAVNKLEMLYTRVLAEMDLLFMGVL